MKRKKKIKSASESALKEELCQLCLPMSMPSRRLLSSKSKSSTENESEKRKKKKKLQVESDHHLTEDTSFRNDASVAYSLTSYIKRALQIFSLVSKLNTLNFSLLTL